MHVGVFLLVVYYLVSSDHPICIHLLTVMFFVWVNGAAGSHVKRHHILTVLLQGRNSMFTEFITCD